MVSLDLGCGDHSPTSCPLSGYTLCVTLYSDLCTSVNSTAPPIPRVTMGHQYFLSINNSRASLFFQIKYLHPPPPKEGIILDPCGL